jgi:hypothetical protein
VNIFKWPRPAAQVETAHESCGNAINLFCGLQVFAWSRRSAFRS